MKKLNLQAIGTAIRRHRMQRKFSIDELAEVLELSPSYIGLLERGDRCMSMKILFMLCDLFYITPNQLLYLDKDRYSDSGNGSDNVPEKIQAAISLLRTLSSLEVDFIIKSIKNLKKIKG